MLDFDIVNFAIISYELCFLLLVATICTLFGIKICKFYNRKIMFKKIDFDALSILK